MSVGIINELSGGVEVIDVDFGGVIGGYLCDG